MVLQRGDVFAGLLQYDVPAVALITSSFQIAEEGVQEGPRTYRVDVAIREFFADNPRGTIVVLLLVEVKVLFPDGREYARVFKADETWDGGRSGPAYAKTFLDAAQALFVKIDRALCQLLEREGV